MMDTVWLSWSDSELNMLAEGRTTVCLGASLATLKDRIYNTYLLKRVKYYTFSI